jgi:hypothetical protein
MLQCITLNNSSSLECITLNISTASYYCRGTLFCSYPSGAVRRLEIGSLSL